MTPYHPHRVSPVVRLVALGIMMTGIAGAVVFVGLLGFAVWRYV